MSALKGRTLGAPREITISESKSPNLPHQNNGISKIKYLDITNGSTSPSLDDQKGITQPETPTSITLSRLDGLEDKSVPPPMSAPQLTSGFRMNNSRNVIDGDDKIDAIDVSPNLQYVADEENTNGSNKSLRLENSLQTRIECPICQELMVSLLQLNRHLDDAHNLDGDSLQISTPSRSSSGIFSSQLSPNDEIRNWLKKTNEVKTKIQTVLPKQFGKFELFNDGRTNGSTETMSTESVPEIEVTRKHWQRPAGRNICSFKGCKKQLNLKNGLVHCRKCGKLNCHEHTNFYVRLNSDADYDSEGTWCRCCQDCFQNKPGYKDIATIRDLTSDFLSKRQYSNSVKQIYENKLEQRITNLENFDEQLKKSVQRNAITVNLLKFKWNSQRYSIERQLVPWEDEKEVQNCFLCMQMFNLILRKHHCRLCGRVVCSSTETECAKDYLLSELRSLIGHPPKLEDGYSILVCKNCTSVLFQKKFLKMESNVPLPEIFSKFELQYSLKSAILNLLPILQEMIDSLQSDENLDNHKNTIKDVSKLRKKLVEYFSSYDELTRQILSLNLTTEEEKKIQLAIKKESLIFIQNNMSLLKSLPRILKKIEERNAPQQKPTISLAAVHEIKRSREELMVLNEQKFLIAEMIENCKKQRKFDEIQPLNDNLTEINENIGVLQEKLGNEGF
ncbi:hypothetical protein WICMUC_004308 [Wickerhamomyces mucosus]|uniref:FYVE-type domain-containing protein n=1 Tax=Wickerhamomyces mucosus TaxID=1378264 RepID=A0A9P8TBM7_9ASCO|nr:hypothetical protein WICMUC_004308 [Wickerhamomyces mucosus]